MMWFIKWSLLLKCWPVMCVVIEHVLVVPHACHPTWFWITVWFRNFLTWLKRFCCIIRILFHNISWVIFTMKIIVFVPQLVWLLKFLMVKFLYHLLFLKTIHLIFVSLLLIIIILHRWVIWIYTFFISSVAREEISLAFSLFLQKISARSFLIDNRWWWIVSLINGTSYQIHCILRLRRCIIPTSIWKTLLIAIMTKILRASSMILINSHRTTIPW